MPTLTNPTDIARETLRLLATRRVAPTPENYQRIYGELSGTQMDPRRDWSAALREVLRHLSAAEGNGRKAEALEKILGSAANESQLAEKVLSQVRAWQAPSARIPTITDVHTAAPAEGDAVAPVRELLFQAIELGVAPRLERHPDLAEEAHQLANQVRAAMGAGMWGRLGGQLRQFWLKVELRSDSDAELLEGLMKVLGLLINNISELVDEDHWVSGQLDALRDLVNEPLSVDNIVRIERGFKDVVYKQGVVKHSLREAKSQLKDLLGTFVDRLAEMSDSTSGFHRKIETYAGRLQSLDDIVGLRALLDELMADTRAMQTDVMRRQEEFTEARRQAETAERRVRELEAELSQMSEQVREDQLTGALNRRGLEDAIEREMARAVRRNAPLCVAVLDLDNFKRLNDTYGHQAGDAALIHLIKVVRRIVRLTDVVARYGGEEFVILFADADTGQTLVAMQRLQRELTKRFFLHNNERLLITFSAGVAEYRAGDTDETLFQRADKAMYQAKVQGKNRVVRSD